MFKITAHLYDCSKTKLVCTKSYIVISQVWVCVVDPIIKDTDDHTLSSDSFLPHRYNIDVYTGGACRLTFVELQRIKIMVLKTQV